MARHGRTGIVHRFSGTEKRVPFSVRCASFPLAPDFRKDFTMASTPLVSLNDGNTMPQLGFGVWQVPNAEAASVVGEALRMGYLSIDTAAIYRNEEGVGEAIRNAAIPREELF